MNVIYFVQKRVVNASVDNERFRGLEIPVPVESGFVKLKRHQTCFGVLIAILLPPACITLFIPPFQSM